MARGGSRTALVILSASAVVAVHANTGTNTTFSLGASFALFASLSLLLVERARHETVQPSSQPTIYSANGFLAQPETPAPSGKEATMSVIRDVSFAAAIGTAVTPFLLESWRFGGLSYWWKLDDALGEGWVVGQAVLNIVYGLVMVGMNAVVYVATLLLVSWLSFVACCCGERHSCLFGRLACDCKPVVWFGKSCRARGGDMKLAYRRQSHCAAYMSNVILIRVCPTGSAAGRLYCLLHPTLRRAVQPTHC